jgi:hypothetical protein
MFNTSARLDQRFVGVLLLAWSITGASAIGLTAYQERAAVSAPAVAQVSPSAVVAIASPR